MTLVLDLVRHGDALPADDRGDAPRALSPRGRTEMTRLAARLTREGWKPGHAFVSSLRRARDTAVILLRGRPNAPLPGVLEALAPEGDPEYVLETVAALGINSGNVLLVSHQPLIGRLAATLTGEEVPFSPGTLVRIECDGEPAPGMGRLTLSIEPHDPA